MKPIVVITTVGSEQQANQLAEELVERRHSCCVNILPVHRSVYRWQGKVCEDSEYMLIVKSAEEEYSAVEAVIQELHEYDLPEILSFDVQRGEKEFLNWMCDCLSKDGRREEAEEAADGSAGFPQPAPES
ncbi:MAG: divalent-cation tolerance protein CutA [Thermoanaerobaculia bacterium]|nr:divalent-cation tolerance protein CutA [Thermoanaerobaculia bacterium]